MPTNIEVYEIETGIPLPQGRALPPLAQLNIGDSVLFSIHKRKSVQSVATRMKREQGKVFKIRKQDDNTARVWRVE